MGFLPRVINMEWVARSFAYYLAKGVFWRCMGKDDKLIKITSFNTELNHWLGTDFESFEIYRSKGLLTHLINRKHFVAAKYIDYLPDLISSPDYIGIHDSNIEMVKCYKDNIFISVKLDTKKSKYFVATVFDVKQSKIDSYVRSGRLIKIDTERNI